MNGSKIGKSADQTKLIGFSARELQQSNSRFKRERADSECFSVANDFTPELYSRPVGCDIVSVILTRDKRSCLTRNYGKSIQTDGAVYPDEI